MPTPELVEKMSETWKEAIFIGFCFPFKLSSHLSSFNHLSQIRGHCVVEALLCP